MWPLAVDVIIAQRDHCLLPASYCVGSKVSIVNLFCKGIKGDRETESVRNFMFSAQVSSWFMFRQHRLKTFCLACVLCPQRLKATGKKEKLKYLKKGHKTD